MGREMLKVALGGGATKRLEQWTLYGGLTRYADKVASKHLKTMNNRV